jgi:hypothetical protein
MEEQNQAPEKTNKLPQWLTTVTPFSKALAMILFIALPFLGFYLGTKYSSLLNQSSQSQQTVVQKSKTITDPTANWKTYTDPKYGFQFKYPPTGKRLTHTSKGDEFLPGECGKSIKSEIQTAVLPSGNTSIYVLFAESWFIVTVLPWKSSLQDYLAIANADKYYDFVNIQGSNADEAVYLINKNVVPTASSPDFQTQLETAYYKKNDFIFTIGGPQNEVENTCTPDDYNSKKLIEESFKFTQ